MKRIFLTAVLALGCWVAAGSAAHAQIFVRAPFVRVNVGPGVWVRAPFVNLYVPSGPTYVVPSGYSVQSPPPPAVEVLPQPGLAQDPKAAPPVVVPAMALEQFAKTFQVKGGSYEVDLINPVTNMPTRVRFTLPEGTPKNVHVRQNEIEFRYGLLRFVRIEFDKDGAQVVSR